MKISSLLLLLLLFTGCLTRTLVRPTPCDTISHVPGLREEMEKLRDSSACDTLLLRTYAKAASSECAYNRAIGADGITPEVQKSWWQRFWEWLT
jgi:hypothetical protein